VSGRVGSSRRNVETTLDTSGLTARATPAAPAHAFFIISRVPWCEAANSWPSISRSWRGSYRHRRRPAACIIEHHESGIDRRSQLVPFVANDKVLHAHAAVADARDARADVHGIRGNSAAACSRSGCWPESAHPCGGSGTHIPTRSRYSTRTLSHQRRYTRLFTCPKGS